MKDLINKVILGDCLEEMMDIDKNSIDAIITDPPFGTTACKWDTVIPFQEMWQHLNRIIKPNGAIVLFGSEPFSSALRMSNIKNYKYDWTWNKHSISNSMLCKKQPLNNVELISIFYKKQPTYNPQMTQGEKWKRGGREGEHKSYLYGANINIKINKEDSGVRYPKRILEFSLESTEASRSKRFHPTQKPVALMEYLIKTYTNENETVLDFAAGSGSTGVACKNLNRNYILIEKEKEYIDIINKRLI